jgi:hypothetical protein
MREHGVANFPAPVDGRLQLRPDSGVDPGSAAFKAAETACKALAPQGTCGGGRQDRPNRGDQQASRR